jgi:hypothetical protein
MVLALGGLMTLLPSIARRQSPREPLMSSASDYVVAPADRTTLLQGLLGATLLQGPLGAALLLGPERTDGRLSVVELAVTFGLQAAPPPQN